MITLHLIGTAFIILVATDEVLRKIHNIQDSIEELKNIIIENNHRYDDDMR